MKNLFIGDQIIFDYSATVDGNQFEGSEEKSYRCKPKLSLEKILFLKGFDEQLIGK